MTNSVLKLPHLVAGISGDEPRESGAVLWPARLRERCGEVGEGVRQLLWRHIATCLGFTGNSQLRVSPTIGDVGGLDWFTMVYLVYCSYYLLLPVTSSSIPSLHWNIGSMIHELEPQRLGVFHDRGMDMLPQVDLTILIILRMVRRGNQIGGLRESAPKNLNK